jgi:hypothetical protein
MNVIFGLCLSDLRPFHKRNYSIKEGLGVINHDMLPSYLKTNQMLFFNIMECHVTFVMK